MIDMAKASFLVATLKLIRDVPVGSDPTYWIAWAKRAAADTLADEQTIGVSLEDPTPIRPTEVLCSAPPKQFP